MAAQAGWPSPEVEFGQCTGNCDLGTTVRLVKGEYAIPAPVDGMTEMEVEAKAFLSVNSDDRAETVFGLTARMLMLDDEEDKSHLCFGSFCCRTPKCDGTHNHRKGGQVTFSNCQAVSGAFSVTPQKGTTISKPSQIPEYGLDDGNYLCKETCDYSAGRGKSGSGIEVIRTGGVSNPSCQSIEE